MHIFHCRFSQLLAKFYVVCVDLLGCNAVLIPAFQRNILSPSSALKMKALCSFEVSVSTYKSTAPYSPEDQHQHLYCCVNLISHATFEVILMISANISHFKMFHALYHPLSPITLAILSAAEQF
jgi:hypothetical protein